MADDIQQIADLMGARIVGTVPDTGPGVLGAERLRWIVQELRGKLVPGEGVRPGRPTNPNWDQYTKIPMSNETKLRLTQLAEQASLGGRTVTYSQIAAQIIEESVAHVTIAT